MRVRGSFVRPRAGDNRAEAGYEPPTEGDGLRILVERLWPRGVSKRRRRRSTCGSRRSPRVPNSASGMATNRHGGRSSGRYRAEIEDKGEVISDLKQRLKEGAVTFVYAAKDESHNSAVVLKEYLEGAT